MSSSPNDVFHPPHLDYGRACVDTDGLVYYEDPYNERLLCILDSDDVAALEQYLEEVNDENILGPRKSSFDDPFHAAARLGSKNCLLFLLELWRSAFGPGQTRMAAPNARGYGLLQAACVRADLDIVLLLLSSPWKAEYGDVQWKDESAETPLISAAHSLPAGPYRSTAEALNRSEEIVRVLLQHGASARETLVGQGMLHETVLSLAVRWASPELLALLIDQGSDINAELYQSYVDLGSSCRTRFVKVDRVTILHIASRCANVGGIQLLLDKNPDLIQKTDSHGRYCLHWAAVGHDDNHMIDDDRIIPPIIETIKLLLSTDRTPSALNMQDCEGETALHYAARRTPGRIGGIGLAIVQTLCEHGADASIRNGHGETPLHSLAWRMRQVDPIDTAFIGLLLSHGASVGDTDKSGNTVLHLAARNPAHVGVARYLLGKGCDLRAANLKGNTPLHEAAEGAIWVNRRATKLGALYHFNTEEMIESQEEMLKALTQGLQPEEADEMLGRRNKDGETPRQICQHAREMWRRTDRGSRRGRGRGRGQR